MSTEDEFQIVATKAEGSSRRWTRTRLSSSKAIADRAIEIGFDRAEVRNIFGGHLSDPLYVAGGNNHAERSQDPG